MLINSIVFELEPGYFKCAILKVLSGSMEKIEVLADLENILGQSLTLVLNTGNYFIFQINQIFYKKTHKVMRKSISESFACTVKTTGRNSLK